MRRTSFPSVCLCMCCVYLRSTMLCVWCAFCLVRFIFDTGLGFGYFGDSDIVVCGGTENMSDAPLAVSGNDARWGVKLGTGLKMRDSLWDGLTDSYGKIFSMIQ